MNQFNLFGNIFLILTALLALLWTISWKVYAGWTAAKLGHKKWFVAIIILNTLGILEIFYIFKIAKKNWVGVKEDFSQTFSLSK